MKENILQLVWKFGLINLANCYTTNGEKVSVVNPGVHNTQNSGPDFSTAKVYINDTLWVGNVEVHCKSSDWFNHLHHLDEAYQNVVLHVVYEDDCGAIEGIKHFPVIELKKCVDAEVWSKIEAIDLSKSKIPCESWLSEMNAVDWVSWQDRLLVERFETKSRAVDVLYHTNDKNWEKVCFQLLCKSLGGTVNKEPFLLLSKLLPFEVLNKHRSNLLSIEALLFGVAGMLGGDFEDLYPKRLKQEYQFLKAKFKLQELNAVSWKYLRMRPVAFPTVQIALLSSLIFNTNGLVNVFLSKNEQALFKLLSSSTVTSPYWENHYKFDKPSKGITKNWGAAFVNRLFINAVIPFQLAKGRMANSEEAYVLLEQLNNVKAEENKVIKLWRSLNVPVKSAFESQSLLELYNNYCCQKKCLICNVGLKVLKQAKNDSVRKEHS